MWKTRHLTACGHHPRPRAEYGLGGPTGVASHGVGAGAGSRSARGSAVLVAGDCLAGRRRPREGGLGGLWKRWSPEMGVKCVAQSCRGRTRNTRGRGGAQRSGDSRGPDPAAVATVLFRAAAGAGRLPRWAGVPGAGGCALHSPLPGDRFRAGSLAPSEGCKQGGALCPPAPGLPGRAAGGARSGGGAAAALGSGGGGAPALRRPRAPPPPGRPASSVFVLMEPACSWRVSSHVPWAGGGWGAGG